MMRVLVLVAAIMCWAGAAAAQGTREDSLQAWARIAEVLGHPRCMNCHPSGDAPRQADDRHLHRMQVMRGADDRGTPAMRCSTCHQIVNAADGQVPGAPHWHLAPRRMGWEGLDGAALCQAVKDPKRNGGRSVDALVQHMTGDALVQWAWNPGRRTPPPVSQFDFHEAVKRWAATGAACPS